jgi:hypothetical protein
MDVRVSMAAVNDSKSTNRRTSVLVSSNLAECRHNRRRDARLHLPKLRELSF